MGNEEVWRPGGRVEGYRLEALLGRGGMGQVFRAVHEESGAVRALKTLLPGADPDELLRFAREGEAQARVDAHPAVARIHGVGSAHGRPFIVLELCEGGSLADRLARRRLPWREAAGLVRQLAAGVAHLHAHGVLHRDLKPENVLFDAAGRPRLVDFGLARLAGSTSLTASGTVLGTPAYLSPEQACGLHASRPADVHALGLLLLTCLAGASPFARATLTATLAAVMTEAAPRASALDPDAPPALDRLVGACLAKEPAERPTADALEASLGALLAASGDGPGRPRSLAIGLASGVLLAGLLAALALRGRVVEPAPPPRVSPTPAAPVASAAPVEAPPPPDWQRFGSLFAGLHPRRVFMCPRSAAGQAGAHDASIALSADGRRVVAALGLVAQVFDLEPTPRPLQDLLIGGQSINDVEWSGDQAVLVARGGEVTWAPGLGWGVPRAGGGWRLAFAGSTRIDTPFVEKAPGMDLVDVVVSGQRLATNVPCTALAARAGKVAAAFKGGAAGQVRCFPLPFPAGAPLPDPSGPPITATIRCLLWLDDASLALGTSDADAFVVRVGGPTVELVTPGRTHSMLEEGQRVAGLGHVVGLAGAGDRLAIGSLDLKHQRGWELAAWSVSRPSAPRGQHPRPREALLALAGDDRRVVALVEKDGDVSLLVFDLPPWPEDSR